MWPYQKWTCRIGLVLDLFILGSLGIFHRGIGLPSLAPLPWSRHSETLPQLLIDAWDQVLFSKLGTPKLTNYQFPQQNCHKLGYHRVSLYNFQALPRRAAFSSWRSTICFWKTWLSKKPSVAILPFPALGWSPSVVARFPGNCGTIKKRLERNNGRSENNTRTWTQSQNVCQLPSSWGLGGIRFNL